MLFMEKWKAATKSEGRNVTRPLGRRGDQKEKGRSKEWGQRLVVWTG